MMMNVRGSGFAAFLAVGLLAPVIFQAVFPGGYVQLWLQFPGSLAFLGPSMLVLLAAVVKTILYLYKHFADPLSDGVQRASRIIFGIHMFIAIPILLVILGAVFARVSPTEVAGIRTFFAFLTSELMIFPIIAAFYLTDILKTQREGLGVPLLVSFLAYVVMMLLTVSHLVQLDPRVLEINQLSPWEQAGARIYFLLIFTVAYITNPILWQTASLGGSVDRLPPPEWVAAPYVIAVALVLYYFSTRSSKQRLVELGSVGQDLTLPIDRFRIASSIAIATAIAAAIFFAGNALLPHNVTAFALQLTVVLGAVLAFTFRSLMRGSIQR
jgi:hypothetical protein